MMKFIYTAIFLSFISLVAITSTYAAMPPDIVVATWTFEGDGAVVEDISGNGYNGEVVVGDVAIFNACLTAAQVNEIMENGLTAI